MDEQEGMTQEALLVDEQDLLTPAAMFYALGEVMGLGEDTPTHRKTLLRYFNQCVDLGQPIPSDLQKYLANAFAEILKGVPADKALGLRRGKGRQPGGDINFHFHQFKG